jgi:hypothetical protein
MRQFTQENTAGYTQTQLDEATIIYVELLEHEMEKEGRDFSDAEEFESVNKSLSDSLAEKALEKAGELY